MKRYFRSLRYIVLVLSLLTSVNTELFSSARAVAGIQRKSVEPSTVSAAQAPTFTSGQADNYRSLWQSDLIWLGYDFPKDMETDAVLITHPHYDHDAGQSRGRPFPGPEKIQVLRDPGRYIIGDISIQDVKGKHADPYGKEFGQINTIWVIEAAGLRIAHIGDNGPLSKEAIENIGGVDILMIPIDAFYHILKEAELQSIFDALNPKVIIPMHYQIPELEPAPDRPKNLGPIGPWLKGKKNFLRLENNERHLNLIRHFNHRSMKKAPVQLYLSTKLTTIFTP